ncbi:AbrB/MazE/SpoVT family DNA-binding domain-containing protein [Methanobrevibacter filiformis]|uniref:Regulator PrlF n=1 Tax=Methanobrevibacter filiformis TaxID=55758 RepID=A0A162FDZ6_9EURY|nr:hypothetical protein [Methanobrevibacter filiformis]KZX11625.1 hypothetical protein MBFIL_13480 [Methanobrevibacter filiformis]
MTSTKLYKNNQTVVPSEIRKKFDLKPDDIIEWSINLNGKPELEFRKKSTLKDILGKVTAKEPINSVKLQKKIERGENI